MGKARRASVAQRRGSVLNVAAPKLAKRIELQKVFNSLLVGSETKVDRRTLMTKIFQTPELHGIFTSKHSEELTYAGSDKSIDWSEFLEFIQKTEGGDEGGGGSNQSSEARVDDPMAYQEMVEKQSKALEIERLPSGKLSINIMNADDVRAMMSGDNIVIVHSDTDPLEVLEEYAEKLHLSDEDIPDLMDHVERAINKACQQELRMLQAMSNECLQQMESMAVLLLSSEAKMLKCVDDNKRSKFMFDVASSKDRRGSVTADVAQAYSSGGGGDVGAVAQTPGELAAKVCQLQKRLEQRELELKHYQKVVFRRRASQALLAGEPLQDIEATLAERDEWRKEVDSRIALIKVTNAERSVLVRDNITLRTTVECGRQAGMFEKLRQQIATERKNRLADISSLQNEISEMEAEVRVGEVELGEMDLDTDSESDSEFDSD
mmetsp:Transcript_21578/g.36306  ORF Transcript_21578/g.36306 Transcript_21578/m.36306 type:complete len:435 (-) Transcript_21578:876-2180(-)